ncbi:M14 family zinc carboxypeptidase [Emticicia sp. TH156]|uniref:M14 family zinc carboxypeptidase n=1 Tax=Emticicia sp. TH156 TaxID=2067454 RepID=UPI000C767537|nr:M14 family zinc carboxypeptidase [Emticicia sp. TH156]PLK46458.1 peptidase M14 [Emticicia sp. TH156]
MVLPHKRLNFVFIVYSLFISMPLIAQTQDYSKALFEKHDVFKETALKHRRFKHKDLVPLIEKLPFEKQVVGQSFEGRDLYQIKLGSGPVKVLLWSQMHGDEPTATMALADIFLFFQGKNDGFDTLRQSILANTTLYFVPMLNPDGAERYQRRTATEIDMNRDALRFQTPEGALLKKLQDELKPEFSFNLHDKNTRYSAGRSNKQATVSFLATAYDCERSWNPTRTRAMQVISGMIEALEQFIPGHLGRWNDEHEPRAFGDNVSKWGSSLILIESGGYKDDTEKQFIRKLNFVAILTGLQAIAEKSYTHYTLATYEALPNNERYLYDLLVRNARFNYNGRIVMKDIGIDLIEKNTKNATGFSIRSVIEEMGDLSTFWGIKEIDATGLQVRPLADFPELIKTYKLSKQDVQDKDLNLDEKANFVLAKGNDVKYVIINGQIK